MRNLQRSFRHSTRRHGDFDRINGINRIVSRKGRRTPDGVPSAYLTHPVLPVNPVQKPQAEPHPHGTPCLRVSVVDSWDSLRSYLAGSGGALFGGAAGDDLVQHGFLLLGAQHAAEALDLLSGSGAATDHDRDVGVG